MKKTTFFIYLASAMTALAHPGHDTALPAESAAHWLFSPVHGLGVFTLAAIAALVGRALRERSGHE